MSSNDNKNYYDILELNPGASLQDIHNAYEKAKNAYSGDSVALYSLLNQDDCERILEQIEEAYTILGSPEKRRAYDIARGLNQNHTPDGYREKITSQASYKPLNSLDDLVIKTEQETAAIQSDRADFEYNQAHSKGHEVNVTKVAAYKKFGLNYIQDEPFEQEIENCTEYDGSFLQKIREYKNVTVDRMSEMTKISKSYIRYIEEDDFTKLPAPVYTRGFVYQYAKCLKLNPDLVATSYMHNLKQLKNNS